MTTHIFIHIGISVQDPSRCTASSASCQWRVECEEEDPVDDDPYSDCCLDLLKHCNARDDCKDAWSSVESNIKSGTCDTSCLEDAVAELSSDSSRLFDRLISCMHHCVEDTSCGQNDEEQCGSMDECEWFSQCTLPPNTCKGLDHSSCTRLSTSVGCIWDDQLRQCTVDARNNRCRLIDSQDACSFNGCQWEERCTSSPAPPTCERSVCRRHISECESNPRCRSTLSCLYNAHAASLTGECNDACFERCQEFVMNDKLASILFRNTASCLLKCNNMCSPETQPSIFESSICVDATSSEITFLVLTSLNPDTNLLRAYCHFFDQAGTCGSAGCTTTGSVQTSQRPGFVEVTCQLPNSNHISEIGKMQVTLYPWFGRNLLSPFCRSDNAVEITRRESCVSEDVECRRETAPRVLGTLKKCGLPSEATHLTLFVTYDTSYGDQVSATCSFWIPTADGLLSCDWHGCGASATVNTNDSTVDCNLPSGLPEDIEVAVTVNVWHNSNQNPDQRWCASHLGFAPSTWRVFAAALFRVRCPVPACRAQYIPRILDIGTHCGIAEGQSTVNLTVEYDPAYGSHARATCGFWEQTTTGTRSCDMKGCEQPAIVHVLSNTIECTLPSNLTDNEEIYVTVQVWHQHNENGKERSMCFSHQARSSLSWRRFDFGAFSVRCPAPPCREEYIPRVLGVSPRCGIADAETVRVNVQIDPIYGVKASATCAFWIRDARQQWSCTWHGCSANADVDHTDDSIVCDVPANLPADGDVRVTVQVWHEDNLQNRRNLCFSHQGRSPLLWREFDFVTATIQCPSPPCTRLTSPRIYRVLPACGLEDGADTIDVGVWFDPSYGDDARATCGFWQEDSDGIIPCTELGCQLPATVVDGRIVRCQLPSNLPSTGNVYITVQVYHVANDESDNDFCFTHRGDSSSIGWTNIRHAAVKFEIQCEAPSCREDFSPRVFSASPDCGVVGQVDQVTISVSTDPLYGPNARATCAFWIPTDDQSFTCEWHGCNATGVINVDGDTITCDLPEGAPSDVTMRVTVKVWHQHNTEGANDNNCFSHLSVDPRRWRSRFFTEIEPSCTCPPGVPHLDCPDLCADRNCLAHPTAFCVINSCGRCSASFYDQEYESYENIQPLDCTLRDRCSGECQQHLEACMRFGPCRDLLPPLLSARREFGYCDTTCFETIIGIIDSTPSDRGTSRRVHFLLRRLWSCYLRCDEESQTYTPTCMLPAETGPCRAQIERWYFNQESHRCELFMYGGCGGNANNFMTKEACEQRCAVGACCTRTIVTNGDTKPTDAFGYDRHGFDRFGFNSAGYARDGYTERPQTYADFSLNTFKLDQDERGLSPEGRDGTGATMTGYYPSTYSRDGLQYQYTLHERYNQENKDRTDMYHEGVDEDGYGYDGYYRRVRYSCEQATQHACQQKESGDGHIEVVAFAPGRSCDDQRCGSPNWEQPRQCVYGGRRWNFGQSFRYGCKTCLCATDGAVHCECNDGRGPRIRREIRDMTVEEIDQFTEAVNALYQSNEWNTFRSQHLSSVPQAHGNPNFWPWHREFLNQLELALREVSGNCNLTLPYWDWTIDVLSPETSPVWNIVGGNGAGYDRCIADGPFSHFVPCIQRRWNTAWPIPSFADLANILSSTNFLQVAAQIEARHGDVHMFVGGTMSGHASPYDPLFFLHHAFIDKLWFDWQVVLGNGNAFPSSLLHITMEPFANTPADVLDSEGQLCVVYQQPGEDPPCNGTIFGGTSETEGYYLDNERPEYNRDGFNINGYDRYGRGRDGYDATGNPVTDIEDDTYISDWTGRDIRGHDSYGLDESGMDGRGCHTISPGPFYIRDIYRVQYSIYDQIRNGTFLSIPRQCSPLRRLPEWWRRMNWMVRDGDYQEYMDNYEDNVQATYDSKRGGTFSTELSRTQHGFIQRDLCFIAFPFIRVPSDDLSVYRQCPPGAIRHRCSSSLCENVACPEAPEAKCHINPCGGCRVEFRNANGALAMCHRPCDSAIRCLRNPCAIEHCKAYPNAICEFNACTGCLAQWFDPKSGERVDCNDVDPCKNFKFNPVCGVDDRTYDNTCRAREAGVEIAYGGACLTCEERCPSDGMVVPACGQDGITYPSACHARCARVSILYLGECQKTPTTCREVNFLKASDEVRQEICNRQASCIPESFRDTENRCFWDSRTRQCGCLSSSLVCDADLERCIGCCNDDLRICLRDSDDNIKSCWGGFARCQRNCHLRFGNTGVTTTKPRHVDPVADVDVSFELELPGSAFGTVDASQVVSALELGLAMRQHFQPQNLSIQPTESRRRDAEDTLNLEINFQSEEDVNTTLEIVNNALLDGSIAEQLAVAAGAADTDGFSFSSVAVAGSSSPTSGPESTTGPDSDSPSSSSFPAGAIAGIVVGILVLALVVGVLVFRKRNSNSTVTSIPLKSMEKDSSI